MKKKMLLRKLHWILSHPIIATINVIMGVVLIIIGCGIFAFSQTQLMISALKRADVNQAYQHARLAQPIVRTFNFLTLHKIPDLEIWQDGLQITFNAQESIVILEQMASEYSSENRADLHPLQQPLSKISHNTESITKHIQHTFFIQDALSDDVLQMIYQAPAILAAAESFLDEISTGEHVWIILLQNTDEIRATGGFPGSYALVFLSQGVITDIKIEDIYDADGQFIGYVSPPAGIKEYTSGNKGLRLPDANWWPDFPKSSQILLQFFALGDKQQVQGIVSLNSSLVTSLLEITGPIELPDYDISLSAENMHHVLRSERGSFFPGSNQKKFLLNQAFTQFQNKIVQLPQDKKLEVAKMLWQGVNRKDVQAYSPEPTLQSIFLASNLSGALSKKQFDQDSSIQACSCQPIEILLVESNVGINKVNPFISRDVAVNVNNNKASITTVFTNNASPLSSTELSSLIASDSAMPAPRNGNGYLNYYRLLISPEYQISSIFIDGQAVTNWDEQEITTFTNEKYLQIGILVAIPEQKTVTTNFQLTSSRTQTPETMIIHHQSGLKETKYSVTAQNNTQEYYLDHNQVIPLQ